MNHPSQLQCRLRWRWLEFRHWWRNRVLMCRDRLCAATPKSGKCDARRWRRRSVDPCLVCPLNGRFRFDNLLVVNCMIASLVSYQIYMWYILNKKLILESNVYFPLSSISCLNPGGWPRERASETIGTTPQASWLGDWRRHILRSYQRGVRFRLRINWAHSVRWFPIQLLWTSYIEWMDVLAFA